MIPVEMITLAMGTLGGGLLKLWGMSNQAKQERELATLNLVKTTSKAVKDAREFNNPGFMFTRRVIAIMLTFFIIAWPKIAAVFWPDIPVTIGWTEIQGGFLFFTSEKEVTIWKEVSGLALTPLDTHLMSAVAGLYFGGSLVGHKR